ncbi:MAG: DMT family transporter [Sporolactobacillus sp.]
MKSSFTGYLELSLAAAIWGGMYVISKYVMTAVSPLALVFLRYLLATATLSGCLLFVRHRRNGNRAPRSWKDWLLIGSIGFVGYFLSIVFQFLGTALSDAHTGSLITAATPAFVAVFAAWLLGEKMTRRKILSLLIATLGVLLTIGLPSGNNNSLIGDTLLIGAAVTWALLSVLVKIAAKRQMDTLQTTTAAMFVALLCTSPFFVTSWQSGTVHLSSPLIVLGTLYLGVVATAAAFFLWNAGLDKVDAAAGSLFMFFQPLTGSLLGALLLGEHISLNFYFGSMLIVCGVLLAAVKGHAPQLPERVNHAN